MQTDELRLAMRKFNAAKNTLRQAHEEFQSLLTQAGVCLLHCRPGERNEPNALCWSYFPPVGDSGVLMGVERAGRELGMPTVLIEAPAPTEEFFAPVFK